MPRDWTRDEIAVRRYCNCQWERIQIGTTVSEADVIVDGRRLDVVNPTCQLHGDQPADDLPEGL